MDIISFTKQFKRSENNLSHYFFGSDEETVIKLKINYCLNIQT